MNDKDASLETRVAKQEAKLEQIVDALSAATKGILDLRRDFSDKFDSISSATRPNFGLMAQWTAVVLAVITAVASPVAYHFSKAIEDLDIKLQREFQLMLNTTTEKVDGANRASIERHDSAVRLTEVNSHRMDTLEKWQFTDIQSDLDELRQRRREK